MDEAEIVSYCPVECASSNNKMKRRVRLVDSSSNNQDRSEQLQCTRTPIRVQTRALKRPCRPVSIRTLISLAIISYIISSQLLMTALIGSIRLLSNGNNDTNGLMRLKSLNTDNRYLIQLANANPAPAPLRAASARSATSQRVPPVNGSMFGKRDLASRLNQRQESDAPQYNDVITEVIEEFLARNNEVNPEETTAAFCRMIIYECNKFSHSRRKSGSTRVIAR